MPIYEINGQNLQVQQAIGKPTWESISDYRSQANRQNDFSKTAFS